jgi:integrase/recombinase XerD
MLTWESALNEFKAYLSLERSFSNNTVEAYLRDANSLADFTSFQLTLTSPNQITENEIHQFFAHLLDVGISPYTQARMLSGIRVFYHFLGEMGYSPFNPVELIQSPRLTRKLPDVISFEEIEKMIAANDLTSTEGVRNKAIVETLYATGMRVSELVNLTLHSIDIDLNWVKIFGKGKKERITPIGDSAIQAIKIYLQTVRNHQTPKKGNEHVLFLNRRGAKLTRVMIFLVIKELAKLANLDKNVSPHTFRHSFASHLVENGADLRSVQEMLGHESITTTEIYTHLDMKYLHQVVKKYHPRERWSY